MKKTLLVISSSLISTLVLSAQTPNGETIFGYSGSLYAGADALSFTSLLAEDVLFGGAGLSVTGGYSDSDFDEDGNREVEGEFDTTAGSVAYAYQFDGFTLGAAFTAIESDFSSASTVTGSNVSQEIEGDGILFTIGGSTQLGDLLLGVQGTFGELSFDSSRNDDLSFFSLVAPRSADFDVDVFQVELVAKYELFADESYSLTPFAKIGQATLEADAFDETGSISVMQLDSFEDDYTYGELGLITKFLSFENVISFARLSVWQDFGDDGVEFSGIDANGNRIPPLENPDIAETVISGEVGFGWSISEDVVLGASLSYSDADAVDGYGAMLSLDWAL